MSVFSLRLLLLLKFDFTVIKTFNDSQRLNMYTGIPEILAAFLECLLNQKAHSYKFCSCLIYEINYSFAGIAIG